MHECMQMSRSLHAVPRLCFILLDHLNDHLFLVIVFQLGSIPPNPLVQLLLIICARVIQHY